MPISSNKKKVENFPTDASQVSPVFVEESDYLNNRKDIKDIEKELGELGIHTSESNPEAWEEADERKENKTRKNSIRILVVNVSLKGHNNRLS